MPFSRRKKQLRNDGFNNGKAEDNLPEKGRVVFNDSYRVSEIIYSDRDYGLDANINPKVKYRPQIDASSDGRQAEIATNKAYKSEAYAENSENILANVKQKIFNETYRLLGIKPDDETLADSIKINKKYQTGDKFEDAMLGIAGTTDQAILDKVKDEAEQKRKDDIAKAIDENAKIVAIEKDSDELDDQTKIEINEFARKIEADELYGKRTLKEEYAPYKQIDPIALNKLKSEEEKLMLAQKMIKEVNVVDDKATPKISSIEEMFIKPNEKETVLFKETAPIIEVSKRAGVVDELKDTQWERVKNYVKEFNTRSYAEIVGNVPGIIDVDHALKVNLDEKFYLDQSQLEKNRQYQKEQFDNILLEYNNVLEKQQARSLKEIFDEINSQSATIFNNSEYVKKQDIQNEQNLCTIDENYRLKQEIKALEERLNRQPDAPILAPRMSALELQESLEVLTPEQKQKNENNLSTDELNSILNNRAQNTTVNISTANQFHEPLSTINNPLANENTITNSMSNAFNKQSINQDNINVLNNNIINDSINANALGSNFQANTFNTSNLNSFNKQTPMMNSTNNLNSNAQMLLNNLNNQISNLDLNKQASLNQNNVLNNAQLNQSLLNSNLNNNASSISSMNNGLNTSSSSLTDQANNLINKLNNIGQETDKFNQSLLNNQTSNATILSNNLSNATGFKNTQANQSLLNNNLLNNNLNNQTAGFNTNASSNLNNAQFNQSLLNNNNLLNNNLNNQATTLNKQSNLNANINATTGLNNLNSSISSIGNLNQNSSLLNNQTAGFNTNASSNLNNAQLNQSLLNNNNLLNNNLNNQATTLNKQSNLNANINAATGLNNQFSNQSSLNNQMNASAFINKNNELHLNKANSLNVNDLNNNNFNAQSTDDFIKQIKLNQINDAQQQIHNNLYRIDQQVINNIVPSTSKINQMNEQYNEIGNIVASKNNILSNHMNFNQEANLTALNVNNDIAQRARVILNTLRKSRMYAMPASKPNYDGNMFNSNYIPPRINISDLRNNATEQNYAPVQSNNERVMTIAEAYAHKKR